MIILKIYVENQLHYLDKKLISDNIKILIDTDIEVNNNTIKNKRKGEQECLKPLRLYIYIYIYRKI